MSRLAPNVSIVMAAVLAGALFGGLVANADDDVPTPTPTPTATDTVTVTPEPTDPITPSAGELMPAVATIHGNSFSSPEVITGRWPMVTFDSTNATTQSGEPRRVGTSHYLRRTMWAKWKAPQSGYVTLQVYTYPDADTGVNVYRGNSLGSLTRVATNDNQQLPVTSGATPAPAPSVMSAIVGMHVTAGKTYYVQVGSSTPLSATANGSVAGFDDLTLLINDTDYSESNDFLVNASTLTLGTGMTVSKTAYLNGSTMERWEPAGNPVALAAKRVGSVWYKWTSPQDGFADLSICTYLESPSIAVFKNYSSSPGTGAGDLSAVAFAFDNLSCANSFVGGAKAGGFYVQKGVTYFFQVARTAPVYGYAGGDDVAYENGTLTLTVDFSKPYIDKISPMSGSHSGGNTVTITGDELIGSGSQDPVVKFGSKTATIIGTPENDRIVVKAPSHSIGSVNVTVTTIDGDTSNPRKYTYK